MHKTQQSLLSLIEERNLGSLTLRQIAELIGKDVHPQQIKHHLGQLQKKGLIRVDPFKGVIERVKQGVIKNTNLVAIPILGTADCGPATSIPQGEIEGYLKLSESILKKKGKNIFAIKAKGISMNRANISGQSIEDGDYVIVDGGDRSAQSNDYVLSIIDGMANIKKLVMDSTNGMIMLLSESSRDFPPIYIDASDGYDYLVNGKVVQVIKNHKNLVS